MTRRDLLLVAALVLVPGHYAAARAHHHGSHSGEDDPVNMNSSAHIDAKLEEGLGSGLPIVHMAKTMKKHDRSQQSAMGIDGAVALTRRQDDGSGSGDDDPTDTGAPTTSAPTGPPTRFDYCLEGYGDYGVRYNWGLGRITIATSHQACSARCSEYSAPQFNGGCKSYQTGMYYGMLYCRSYGGNRRTIGCAPWAVPTHPGLGSGALGSIDPRTGNTNVGGNCCSNTTFVVQTTLG